MVSVALWVVLGTAGLVLVVAWRAWHQQPNPGARSFAISMVGIAFWLTVMFVAELLVDSNRLVASLLFRIEGIGAAVLAVYWFRFALEYTGSGEYVTRRLLGLIAVFPAVGVPIAFGATQYLELYATWLGVDLALPPWDLWPVYEPFGFVYLYVLLVAGFLAILGMVVNRQLPRPELASLWLVGAVVPMVVGMLYIAGVFDPLDGIDPTPFAFVVTGVVGLTAISRYDAFQAAPIARNHVVDRIEAGMVVFDDDYRIHDYNEWARTAFDLDESVGEDVRDAVVGWADEADPTVAASVFADQLDGTELTIEKSGDRRHLSVAVSTLDRPDGQRHGYVVLASDVTVQRRYQRELSRQNDRLEQLADVVGHDLRNPLDVGLGQARRLQQRLDAADTTDGIDHDDLQRWRDRAAEVVTAIDRSTVIVEDMLALTRGGQELTDTDRLDLVETATLAWTYVDTGDLELVTEGSVPTVGDRSRLEQVFENLYSNTVDHAPDATEIRVGPTGEGLYVEDDGSGIEPDKRAEIFQPGQTTAPEGTGLGLCIVREIIQAHDWEITVTDGTDGGARFEIKI